jgi:hypothetical protein
MCIKEPKPREGRSETGGTDAGALLHIRRAFFDVEYGLTTSLTQVDGPMKNHNFNQVKRLRQTGSILFPAPNQNARIFKLKTRKCL